MPKTILHIVSGNASGGAALAVRALHDSLISKNYQSLIVFDSLDIKKPSYLKIGYKSKLKLYLNKIFEKLYYLFNKHQLDIFSNTFGLDVHKEIIQKIDPDIVHVHWISRSGTLKQYFGNFKTVITARDMWWATGGCHYSLSCDQYQDGCKACAYFDRSKSLTNRKRGKKEYLEKATVIVISRWLQRVFVKSGIQNAKYIENSVSFDTKVKIDTQKVDNQNKFVFLPTGNLNSKYKGIDKIIDLISNNQDYVFIFAGPGRLPKNFRSLSNIRSLGFIPRQEMNWYYKNSELVIIPSIQEAFGKTVIEALLFNRYVTVFRNTAPYDILCECLENPDKHLFLDEILKENIPLRSIDLTTLKINENKIQRYNAENVVEKYIEIYS